ncbi:MAG: hypothetical protein JO250_04960 [Armatimonadetes bacterium]|nr:hypothetical protein [Armatimonadota bacterium]
MTTPAPASVSLDTFQNDFHRRLIRRVTGELCDHYGDRLVSVYVYGSVHRNEALTGPSHVSDLDAVVFLTDAMSQEDRDWRSNINDRLLAEFPGPQRGWVPPAFPLSRAFPPGLPSDPPEREATISQALTDVLRGVKPDAAAAALVRQCASVYLLRYDSTRVWGRDLLADLDAPAPDRLWARTGLQQPWDLARHAAGLAPARLTAYTAENVTEYPLPADAALRLRKLARLGVLGGAYLLMGRGQFRSFAGADVLPPLMAQFPEWTSLLSETERLYVSLSVATSKDVSSYLTLLIPWMDHIGRQLE